MPYRGTSLAELSYNALIRTSRLQRYRITSKLWWRTWHFFSRTFSGPVRTTIHNTHVIVNYGNTYPFYARWFPKYNMPLIELVYQTSTVINRKLSFVDVGAAIGDSILLITSNCPDVIGDFWCIEGDPEFGEYLVPNLQHLKRGHFHLTLLSASTGVERELVRTHGGTASAQGSRQISASTLDIIMQGDVPEHIDVLKVDTDGFDGKILLGAQTILSKFCPSVIFEWHPTLCLQTGNNWTDHFNLLNQCNYDRLIWFTKYGDFSHISKLALPLDESLSQMAEVCLRNKYEHDWHYDIVALHRDSKVSAVELAELGYARKRKSPY